MQMSTLKKLTGLEILDSRGKPTVKAICELSNGIMAQASIPSGASTGKAEALELRDGDPDRYAGQGCRMAARHISQTIHSALQGRNLTNQAELDRALVDLDGTPDKSRLGANALLAVSIAFARAQAIERSLPFYRHLADMAGTVPCLPRPMINLFSGGKHAGAQVPIQDVLVAPVSALTMDQALVMATAVYRSAAHLCYEKYQMRLLTADEGGLAPSFPDVHAMFSDAVTSIQNAGYQPGGQVALAIDVAASHFFQDGRYMLGGSELDSLGMIDRLVEWQSMVPIISIEDGLAEDDWPHWPVLCRKLDGRAITLGDDLLCTNPARIRRAVDTKAANALLLKVNQIGTLTEAAQALSLARASGWQVVVSARSGETEDHWLADLAVGWAGDYIKVGSVTQSDRLAKYNRLLEIESMEREVKFPLGRK
jgi:enolase